MYCLVLGPISLRVPNMGLNLFNVLPRNQERERYSCQIKKTVTMVTTELAGLTSNFRIHALISSIQRVSTVDSGPT